MINKKDLLLFDDTKLYTMKEIINILNLHQITYFNKYVQNNRLKPYLKRKQEWKYENRKKSRRTVIFVYFSLLIFFCSLIRHNWCKKKD